MSRDRTKRERLDRLIPDPRGATPGYVPAVTVIDPTTTIYTLVPNGSSSTGTVMSVSAGGLSPLFTSNVATPTTTPALAFTPIAQAANKVFAGPTTGADANPTFRLLVAADIPALPYGTGTVTSVGLSLPGIFSITVSPVTTTGTLTAVLATQTANTVWAGPTSGGVAQPAFRALVAADIPATLVTRAPGCIFNNGSITLSGTMTDEIYIPYSGTITAWEILGDVAGSASIAVSNSTYANYDTMTSLFTATCTTAKKAQATGLSTALVAGALRFSGSGFSGFTRCSIVLTVTP